MKKEIFLDLPKEVESKQPIVFFDGDCSLCNSSVRFLIRNNNSGNLYFASLQSETGSKLMILAGPEFQQTDSILLLEDNTIYSHSNAAIKITKHLRFPLNLLGILVIVPVSLRDYIYRFVARNRYRWFGKKSFCSADEKGYQNRILN